MIPSTARADVYRAVSDGTRRALLDLLAEGEHSVGELAAQLPISQPAVSQQLSILESSGLATVRREGRQRIYELRADPLADVHSWVAFYSQFWPKRLELLGDWLDRGDRP